MRSILQFFSWLILSIAYVALCVLEWIMKQCEWCMLSDEERWEREDEEERERMRQHRY